MLKHPAPLPRQIAAFAAGLIFGGSIGFAMTLLALALAHQPCGKHCESYPEALVQRLEAAEQR